MSGEETSELVSLREFFIHLAINSQLQYQLSQMKTDEDYQQFLVEQGLSEEDAALLTNARASDEGRQNLVEKLGTSSDIWRIQTAFWRK